MSQDFKLLKGCITDEKIIDSLHKFQVDNRIESEEEVLYIALYELFQEEDYI